MAHWLAGLDGRRVVVEVPASSANLGAGYDCLGVALELTDRVELEVRSWSRGAIELTIDGEGRNELTEDRDNRFVQALEATLVAARGELPAGIGWRIEMRNRIPLSRGLGSSAAASVAGVVAANTLLGNPLSIADQLPRRDRHRGPPGQRGRRPARRVRRRGRRRRPTVEAMRFDVPRDLRAVLFIPELRLSTTAMRQALPTDVPLADAVWNLGAVGLGVAGLAAGRTDLLRHLTVDRLHEPYRAAAYPQLPRLVQAARDAGALGACLSGAGSTILAFTDSVATITRIDAAFSAVAADTDLPGKVVVVSPRNAGATVVSAS